MINRFAVCYEDFGAVGDGIADDFTAIKNTHDYANKHGLPVIADPAKTYYIGNNIGSALIMTDTDWGAARFIIDDSKLGIQDREHNVFTICSEQKPVKLNASSVKKGQIWLDFNTESPLQGNAFVVAEDENKKRYIRLGLNEGPGVPQTDCFILDQSGCILTPVIWDFDSFTSLIAYPIDERILTIKGGNFITIANQAESKYTYYSRGIKITRSNVVVDGVVHSVINEMGHGAPYGGFVATRDCAYITFKNCHFAGHKIYKTIGAAGEPVSMGTYDISLYRSIGVSFMGCKQNNILDTTRWGVFGSNHCKDIIIDNCILSRIDAHMGVTNLTVRNSIIGWMGIKAIGRGQLLIENTSVFSGEVVEFRPDYGSHWDGELVISNVKWYPLWKPEWKPAGRYSIITGYNDATHDFGYPCSLPKKITINDLTVIDDELAAEDAYDGVNIISLPILTDEQVAGFGNKIVGDYTYALTSELTLNNVSTQRGKCFAIWSDSRVKNWYPDVFSVTNCNLSTNK